LPESNPTLMLCYDGSDRAKGAIEVAAHLFPGATAKVVHVWEPVEHIVARYAVLAPYLGENIAEADTGVEQQSSSLADEGAKLATGAGLAASPHNATLKTTVWEAVITAAQELDADLIITGTRSLHGARELLAGTLSHALLQHSAIPLLAIPAPLTE
jgi:nucleotide-binding universal stress UspA family protein